MRPKHARHALVLVLLLSHPVAAQTGRPIRLGTLDHSFGFLHVDIAQAQGWFQSGQTTIQVIPFRTGKDAATALLGGEIDAAVLGIEHGISGQVENKQIKQLVLLNQLPGWTIITSLGDSIHEIADLRNRKIGVTSPGSATHVLLNYLLQRHNISQTEYTAVRAGVATLPDILSQGGIDAGVALEPHGSSAVSEGRAGLLLDLRSAEKVREVFGTNYPVTSLLVRQELIEQRRTDVQALATALVWACKWLNSASADDVIRLLPREFIPDPVVWRRAFEQSREVFSPNGAVDTAAIRTVVAAQVAFGTLDSPGQVDVRSLYDLTFWQRANAVPLPNTTPAAAEQAAATRPNVALLFAIGGAILIVLIGWIARTRAQRRISAH